VATPLQLAQFEPEVVWGRLTTGDVLSVLFS
jgi:hypothetical protein